MLKENKSMNQHEFAWNEITQQDLTIADSVAH